MADKFEEKELSDKTKSNQPLTGMQKLLFGMVCWGVNSWGQADSFKANGYDRKHRDAVKAMHIGIATYSIGITLFILVLILLR
jgi:hypothetical protein